MVEVGDNTRMQRKTATNTPRILLCIPRTQEYKVIHTALEAIACVVLTAANGDECAVHFVREQPELVILGADVPDGDGFSICERLQKLPRNTHTPILMVTGQSVNVVERALAAGAEDVITLPISPTLLNRYLARWLRSRQISLRLEENESWYRHLFEQNWAMTLLIDPATHAIIMANPSACQFYGYSLKEFKQMRVDDFTLQSPADINANFGKIMTHTQREFVFQHRLKNGDIRDVEVYATPIFIESRQLVYAIIHDVTERKRMEEALRDNERKYRHLFENASDAIYVVDVETSQFVDCNAKALRYLGYSRDELLTKTLADVETMSVANGTAHTAKRDWHSRDNTISEQWFRRKDGTVFPVETSIRLFEYDGRQVAIKFVRDISQRKTVEDAEREQRTLAEALRDTAAVLTASLDYGEVISRILEQVQRVVPYESASIMLIDDGKAKIAGHHGLLERGHTAQLLSEFSLDIKATRNLHWMVESKQPLAIADTAVYSGWDTEETIGWIKSYVGAPLISEDQVIGFINLDSSTANTYQPHHAERLMAFANQAAIAMRNARRASQLESHVADRTTELTEVNANLRNQIAERERAEAAEREQRALAEALRDIATIVNSSLSLDEVIRRILEQVSRVVPADAADLMLVEEGVARLADHIGFIPPGNTPSDFLNLQLEIEHYPNLRRIRETREPVVIGDVKNDGEWVRTPQSAWVRANICAPILVDDYLIGFLSLSSRHVDAFTVGHAHRLQTFATHAAIAIKNADYATQLEQRVAQRTAELSQANVQLRHSEERYRQSIENSPNPIFSVDRHGIVQSWNSACENFFQHKRDILGQHYQVLLWDAETRNQVDSIVKRIFDKRESLDSIEIAYKSKDGTERHTVSRLYPLFDADGDVTECVFGNTDITERIAAQKRLQQNEERLRDLIHNMPVMLNAYDENGLIVAWNRECERVTGYTADEMIGNPEALRLLYATDEKLLQLWQKQHESGATYRDWEIELQAKDQTVRTISWSNISQHYPISGWASWSIGVDVTMRVHAEEALRVSERELQSKTESLTVSNAIADYLYRSLDFRTVVERALDSIAEYTQVQSAGILFLDEDADTLNLLSSRGFTEETLKVGSVLPLQGSLSGLAVQRKEIVTSVDLQHDERIEPDVRAALTQQQLNSVVVIPLLFQEQVLGTMNLIYEHVHHLTEQERETLLSIGKTIGLAMVNARYVMQIEEEVHERQRAEQAERERSDQLEQLRQASLVLTASHDLQTILNLIAHYALRLVDADNTHIFLFDGQKLSFGTALRMDDEIAKPFAEPRQDGLTYTVAREGKRLVVSDLQAHPMFKDTEWRGAIVGLPLRIVDQVRGVMNVAFTKPHNFDENELRALDLLSDQAAIAIANAQYVTKIQDEIAERQRAEKAEREQRAMAEALRDTAAILTSSLDYEEVVSSILEQVKRVVPYKGASILLIHGPNARMIGYRGLVEGGSEAEFIENFSLDIHEAPNLRWMIDQKQPLVIRDVSKIEGFKLKGGIPWIRSTVGAPLVSEGQVVGFIHLDSDEVGTFSETDAERLMAFANQASNALRNARKAAELETHIAERTQELELERAQLRAILDAMRDGVVYRTISGEAQYINQALSDLTGYTAQDWLDRENDIRHALIRGMWSELDGDSRVHVERHGFWRRDVKMYRNDDTMFDANITVTSVKGADDNIVGLVTVIRDISQEKALHEQKARFITAASHELRTPITNLKTRLYLLKHKPDALPIHLPVLNAVADNMQKLVESLFDISRFERGIIDLSRQEMILQKFLNHIIVIHEPDAQRMEIILQLDMVEEPLCVYGDEIRLKQVVDNLLSNAMKFTPPEGKITIRLDKVTAEAGDAWARIQLQDSGVGISAEHVPHLFQPFFRGDQDKNGAGLGLSIAREIVLLHGGDITVESQPGKGSTFTVKLPLIALEAAPSRP